MSNLLAKIDKDWLASLQAGQTWLAVLPYRHQPGGRIVSVNVARRTATQIIAFVDGEEQRYRSSNGQKVGDEWRSIPTPASEELVTNTRKENRRLNMAARLWTFDFKTLPYETVEAMYKLLPAQTTAA